MTWFVLLLKFTTNQWCKEISAHLSSPYSFLKINRLAAGNCSSSLCVEHEIDIQIWWWSDCIQSTLDWWHAYLFYYSFLQRTNVQYIYLLAYSVVLYCSISNLYYDHIARFLPISQPCRQLVFLWKKKQMKWNGSPMDALSLVIDKLFTMGIFLPFSLEHPPRHVITQSPKCFCCHV